MRQKSVEKDLRVSFRDKSLLLKALVHSSYMNEHPSEFKESNERLEFLGDALVGLVVAHEVYRRYPDLPEGQLTEFRSAVVRGESLAHVGEELNLGQHLLMGKGEEAGGGRQRRSNLAAAFEALVGAVFLDRGYDKARDFILRVLRSRLDALARPSVSKNSKSALQEMAQAKGLSSPVYRVTEVTGEDHTREFEVEVEVDGRVAGRGRGRRKSQAEQEAASQALEALGEDS